MIIYHLPSTIYYIIDYFRLEIIIIIYYLLS